MMKYTRLLPKIRILIILLLIHVRPGIHQYILENTIAGPFVSQSKRIRNYSCFKPANVLVNESLLFPPHTSLLKVWLHIYIVGILYNFYLILIHFADSFHLSTEYLLCFYSKALKYDQHHEKRGTCPSQKSVYPTSVVSMPPSSGNSQCLTHFKVLCDVLYNCKQFRPWSDPTSEMWRLICVYTDCHVWMLLFPRRRNMEIRTRRLHHTYIRHMLCFCVVCSVLDASLYHVNFGIKLQLYCYSLQAISIIHRVYFCS